MDYSWQRLLSAVILVMQSKIHTTLGTTPMQLVFGQDSVLNLLHEANWQLIKICKQELIKKNIKKKTKSVLATHIPGQTIIGLK